MTIASLRDPISLTTGPQTLAVTVTLTSGRDIADWDYFVCTIREDPGWTDTGGRRAGSDLALPEDPVEDGWAVAQEVQTTDTEGTDTILFTLPGGLTPGVTRYALDVWGVGGAAGEVQLLEATWASVKNTSRGLGDPLPPDTIEPLGPSGSVLYNSGGTVAGEAAFSYNDATNTLTAGFFVGDGSGLTNVGGGFAVLAAANTFTLGPQTLNTGGAANRGLIVKGAAAQTANLQEWQDSTGAVLATVVPESDRACFKVTKTGGGTLSLGNNWGGSGYFGITASTDQVIVIDSGAGIVFRHYNSIPIFDSGAGNEWYPGNAVSVGLSIKGLAGQTADLQHWKNSAAAVLAAVTASGAVEMVEQTDPAAPAADRCRVFCRDNGAGKTQLCVRFPTGAVQVIATEP